MSDHFLLVMISTASYIRSYVPTTIIYFHLIHTQILVDFDVQACVATEPSVHLYSASYVLESCDHLL